MATRRLASRLAACPVLGCLTSRELRGLARQATWLSYGEGEPVVVEGDRGIGFYVVLSGCASVSIDGELRRALREGDCFGELSLLGCGQRSATVVAATDLECAAFAVWIFTALLRERPCVAEALSARVALYDSFN
jgi:CRP-like cAMP-binding protein